MFKKKIQGQMKTSLFEGQNNNLSNEKCPCLSGKQKYQYFPNI